MSSIPRALGAVTAALITGTLANCGPGDALSEFRARESGEEDGGGSGGSSGGLFGEGGAESSRPCVGLECAQVTCAGGTKTTLTGKVYAPEGTVPLYNAIVYVPNAKVEPFATGVKCEQCGQVTGSPIATALTNEKGEFRLENVPAGDNIPVVIQIGKWRRQITVPKVEKCVDAPLPAGDTRLPRTKSEGDMPQIAFTSGSADSLECFLRKLGIADSEFTDPGGNGKVHYLHGNGARLAGATPEAVTLWNSAATLKKYDIAVLSCEGAENTGDKAAHYAQMHEYMNAGGRVFASHYHYVWFRYGPAPLPTTAAWNNPPSTASPYQIDTDFPKGNAFADWLVNVGATPTRGTIALEAVRNSVGDTNAAVARRWIRSDTPKTAKYFSFNTPIGQPPDKQCGRAVFTDVHVGGAGVTGTFPTSCNTNPLNVNEKALIFLFFDLSSCVQDETKPPAPPPIIPK